MTARNPKEPSGRGRQDEAEGAGGVPCSTPSAFVGPLEAELVRSWLVNGGHTRGRVASARASEIARRWNAHAALVEALEGALDALLRVRCGAEVGLSEIESAEAALKLARGERS